MNISINQLKIKFRFKYSKHLRKALSNLFWFLTGAFLSFLFLASLGYFTYQKIYENKIYPGIFVNNVNFGGETQSEVKKYFDEKNEKIGTTFFEFTTDYGIATVSAKNLSFGYNSNLLSTQVFSIGRSSNLLSNLSLILQAYTLGLSLPATYSYSEQNLAQFLKPFKEKIDKDPIDAQFLFENGRVITFKPSSNGQTIDIDRVNQLLSDKFLTVIYSSSKIVVIPVPIKILEPSITTEKANNLGIKELIGEGHSFFFHSIPGRIFNINLGSARINGILVAPGEVFSFDKALGDVSAFTGYKQAYVIQNGHTVLGDGGGICQVSTTFFRALLNAGLPIIERHAHAYRVGYYEQDSPPGIDATIFTPTVDLKFKNDTDHYILIQRVIDLNNLSLAFYLYGTKDGREVKITTPVITSQTAPPPALYQDDPSLPIGEIKQTDFEAWGANVYFTRTVTKNGRLILVDKYVSNYQPWQAVFMKGTKQ